MARIHVITICRELTVDEYEAVESSVWRDARSDARTHVIGGTRSIETKAALSLVYALAKRRLPIPAERQYRSLLYHYVYTLVMSIGEAPVEH
jgi:hypothetical protein